MPNGYRKFRTVHKFGKSRRKSVAKRRNASLPSTEPAVHLGPASDNTTTAEREPATDAHALDFAPTVAAAAVQGTGAARPERTRLGSTFLTSADCALREQQTQQRLSQLASVSATERKMKCVASDSAPSATTAYTVVDLDLVNNLFEYPASPNSTPGIRFLSTALPQAGVVKNPAVMNKAGPADYNVEKLELWSSHRL
ncbi:hypothetical protein MRX96_052258 [Rhipicephalus microplus]